MTSHPRLFHYLDDQMVRYPTSTRHPEEERLFKVMVIFGDFARHGVRCWLHELGSSDLTRARAVRCETSNTQRILACGRSGLEADRADEDTGRELPPTTIFIFTSDTKLTTPPPPKKKPRTNWLIKGEHVFLLPPWADERSVVEKGTGRFSAVCFSPI